ncbi:hypothetical protein ACVINH_004917 [Rhizobium anhuiense]
MRDTRCGANHIVLVKWIAPRGVVEATWRLIIIRIRRKQRFVASDRKFVTAGLVMGYRLFEQ